VTLDRQAFLADFADRFTHRGKPRGSLRQTGWWGFVYANPAGMGGPVKPHGSRFYWTGSLRATVTKNEDKTWTWVIEHGVVSAERGPYVAEGRTKTAKQAMREAWVTLWSIQGWSAVSASDVSRKEAR
jgi:hypothetical protein